MFEKNEVFLCRNKQKKDELEKLSDRLDARTFNGTEFESLSRSNFIDSSRTDISGTMSADVSGTMSAEISGTTIGTMLTTGTRTFLTFFFLNLVCTRTIGSVPAFCALVNKWLNG